MKIVYILTFPIQYHSPLLSEMAKNEEIELIVYYLSSYGVKGDKRFHPDLGVVKKWDIPLLEGYNFKFLKNYNLLYYNSLPRGFLGFINPNLFLELYKDKPDLVLVNGWNNLSYIMAAFISKLLGYKTAIRGDNPIIHELDKNSTKRLFKKVIISKIFNRLFDYFLYVGKYNKEFYRYYGVPDNKLIFTPHAVANNRFENEFIRLSKNKEEIKKRLKIPLNSINILFCGLLIEKKRPFDLLLAFERLTFEIGNHNLCLIYVGDGPLKKEMLDYVNKKSIQNIMFVGFQNQTEIPYYYTIANVLVLPSSSETWGLVVNEAMNFGLPIIVSDMVGCGPDLVRDNGFIFKVGDIDDLAGKLKVLVENDELRKKMGEKSLEIIKNYSYQKVIDGILEALSNDESK